MIFSLDIMYVLHQLWSAADIERQREGDLDVSRMEVRPGEWRHWVLEYFDLSIYIATSGRLIIVSIFGVRRPTTCFGYLFEPDEFGTSTRVILGETDWALSLD